METINNNNYLVQVIDKETEEVIHEVQCKSYRGAERVQDGIEINLDQENYYTKLIML